MPELLGGDDVLLTGWGRTAPSRSRVASVDAASVPEIVRAAGPRGVLARGLGRSYGDAAQNAGGTVLARLPSRIELIRGYGGVDSTVGVSAGTSIDELIRALVPTGHFVPVSPGTRQVTVGGAIASDVHGKNHHGHGSIGRHVVSLDLVVADGTVRTIGPDSEPELFWSTVGGMGLTGVIVSAVLRVPAVVTGWMRVRTERLPDLGTLISRMREADREATYSVAWIDTLARGASLGRSVLTLGEHAGADDLGSARSDRWNVPSASFLSAPRVVPPRLISRTSVRAFNELWYRRAPLLREGEIQSIAAFFHPLDLVAGWNRLYGRGGLVQYQLVVPDAAEDALPEILERIARAGHPSFLSVLKRFGPGTASPLSFPMQGWTLALDLPASPGLQGLLGSLDDRVAELGGRLYLAKDSRMSPATFAHMYPRLDDFRAVLAEVDPTGVFQSDLARRLRIHPRDAS